MLSEGRRLPDVQTWRHDRPPRRPLAHPHVHVLPVFTPSATLDTARNLKHFEIGLTACRSAVSKRGREATEVIVRDYEAICGRVKSSAPTSDAGDQVLIQHATKVAASTLIVPSPEIKKPAVPVKGTIAEYVAAVANTNGVGVLGARFIVPCRAGAGRCVRIEGSPCANAKKKDGCEGVGLSVTIGFAAEKPILVEAYGPNLSAVRTQADVEKLIDLSP